MQYNIIYPIYKFLTYYFRFRSIFVTTVTTFVTECVVDMTSEEFAW